MKTHNMTNTFKPNMMKLAVSVALVLNATQSFADIKLNQIEVISTTPLHSSGVPINEVPSNVQVVKGKAITNQQSLNLADYMKDNMLGVNVNETQNNPFQQDVNFHGFTASPLLGTPQGLSVYQDGVRVNEPFGDTVNWDLIPKAAISGINLMPGSNPLFGLNTLGGALSIQTKSGDLFPGGSAQAMGGSWGRVSTDAEFGGSASNGANYYISGSAFHEDGWRDNSRTDVRQLFSKVGWKGEKDDFSISFSGADNDMTGNGMMPLTLMASKGRSAIYTQPDNTKNKLGFLTGQYNHWFSNNLAFNSVAYYRKGNTKTYNADVSDDMVEGQGVINRTETDQDAFGLTGQFNWTTDKNQLIVGAGYDRSEVDFAQTEQNFTAFSSSRGVGGSLKAVDLGSAVSLNGITETWSVFATDTYKLTPKIALTASSRYNHTEVRNLDNYRPDASNSDSLTGNHTFSRVNPAIGLTYNPTQSLGFYGGYNEGSRAPTSIELGCANPDRPCNLPNAMAGDPPLKQVVAKTFEGGVRGKLGKQFKWSAAAYTTENSNDIQFVASNISGAGYFHNVGKTQRSGIDLGFNALGEKSKLMLGYSYVKATYESDFTANNITGKINVQAGDMMPGIPQHQFKLRGEYNVQPNWMLGTNVTAFSDQYLRGNENNADPKGKVASYTVVNLDTRYSLNNTGWQIFGKVNNLFDKDYASGGVLGQNYFTGANGTFGTPSNDYFVSPGAPRAGWIGARYSFGGSKQSAGLDSD